MRHNASKQAQGLHGWLVVAPSDATVLEVTERPTIGNSVAEQVSVLDWTKHAGSDLVELARALIAQSEAWAEGAGRETGFVARFRDASGQVLVSHQWRCTGSETEGALSFTGEVGSIIQQLQQQNHVLLKMHLEGVKASQVMYREALQFASDRIRALEEEAGKRRNLDAGKLEMATAELLETHETARLELFMDGAHKLLKALHSGDNSKAAEAVQELRSAAQPGATDGTPT